MKLPAIPLPELSLYLLMAIGVAVLGIATACGPAEAEVTPDEIAERMALDAALQDYFTLDGDSPVELIPARAKQEHGFYRVVRFPDLDRDELRGCTVPNGGGTHPSIILASRSGNSNGPLYAQGKPGELFIGRMSSNSSTCSAGTISDEPFRPLRRQSE